MMAKVRDYIPLLKEATRRSLPSQIKAKLEVCLAETKAARSGWPGFMAFLKR